MAVNDLPFQNNTWEVAAQVAFQHTRFHTAALVISVTEPVQLAAALAQRAQPVVIENVAANKMLVRLFSLFVRNQYWWLGALLAYAISEGYGVQLSRTEWRGTVTIEHKIILTPR
jgi:hypothetical protein